MSILNGFPAYSFFNVVGLGLSDKSKQASLLFVFSQN